LLPPFYRTYLLKEYNSWKPVFLMKNSHKVILISDKRAVDSQTPRQEREFGTEYKQILIFTHNRLVL
jgi:hypothetical protein